MARVKSPSARTHRRTLRLAKGFKQSRRRRIKVATEAVMHAGAYAFHGRKRKKRDLRSLWITRINAGLGDVVSYSKFIKGLTDNKIELDRKILSEIAVSDIDTFKKVVEEAGFKFTSKN